MYLKLFLGLMAVVCHFLEIQVIGVFFHRRDNVLQLDNPLGSMFHCRVWATSSGVVSMVARKELAVAYSRQQNIKPKELLSWRTSSLR